MAVAIVSIASSAVLVEYADASSVALTFWRCLAGGLILIPPVVASSAARRAIRESAGTLVAAGCALGIHFATWLASLELTSTAASVTLVSTAPIFVVLWRWVRGRPPTRTTLVAVVLAVIGAAVLAGWRGAEGTVRGDLLALAGAIAMAAYLLIGAEARQRLDTRSYAASVYLVAAFVMIPLAALRGDALAGFDRSTWLAIAAMVIGPQIGGHTGLNFLVGRIGTVLVSMVMLAEAVAASLLAWLILGEVPPEAAVVGMPLVLGGLYLAIRDGQRGAVGP
jgi:drug/metabolite transporter (DMT)-like permease